MVVLYFTIGQDLDMYVQAYLSISSFKKQLKPDDKIVVVATDPDYFNRLGFVETIRIDDNTVNEWKGKHNFFWRAKIKAIETVGRLYPDDDLLYLDCDTFLYGDLEGLRCRLKQGKGFMDGNEGHPSKIKFKPRRMYRVVAGKTHAGITISEKHDMWCAGVVAIPSGMKETIVNTALALCDGMLDDEAEPIVVEQYSLSIAMSENLEMVSSKTFIAHYWANKQPWIELVRGEILKSYFTGSSSQESSSWIDSIDYSKIPIYVRKHTTNRKLKKLVDKLYPDEDLRYLDTKTT